MNEALKDLGGDVLCGNGLFVGKKENLIETQKTSIICRDDYINAIAEFPHRKFDFIILDECIEPGNIVGDTLACLFMLRVGGNLIATISSLGPKHDKDMDVIQLIGNLPSAQVKSISRLDANFDNTKSGVDQNVVNPEFCISVVLRKTQPVVKKRSFKHSGARGDLLYSLPTIKALGGGTLYINRNNEHYFHLPISDEEMEGIVDLLKTQPYIDEVVEWNGQPTDIDLDLFRQISTVFINLSTAHQIRFGSDYDLREPWIDVSKILNKNVADIIVSRTSRYHAPFDWGELKPWLERAMFVGSPKEHADFVEQTGFKITYLPTATWGELSSVIHSSKLFIGNQSMAYAMAEGMKHPRVLESCLICPNCEPNGDNGHVRLTQNIIRKYLCGEAFDDDIRKPRSPFLMRTFKGPKKIKEGYENVSCVLFGIGAKADSFEKALLEEGAEIFRENKDTFEESANAGVSKTSRRIICIIDANLCQDTATIDAVVRGIFLTKSGMMTTSMSTYGSTHVSGPCLAVSRDVYERAGLFNLALKSGEAGMLDMVLRYSRIGIRCSGLGIPKLQDRPSTEEDEKINCEYLERHWGIKV